MKSNRPKHIQALRSPSSHAEKRYRAAQALGEETSLSKKAIQALIHALDDEGSWEELWEDQGFVVGGERHYVANAAAKALAGTDTETLEQVVVRVLTGHKGAHRWLPFLVKKSRPAQLAALDDDFRGQLHRLIEQAPKAATEKQAALEALAWSEEEESDDTEDLAQRIHRLEHPDKEQRAAAAEALGEVAEEDAPIAAAALVDALLRKDPPLGYSASEEAARSLRKLGPVLDDARLQALLDAAEEDALRYHLPYIFTTFGNHQFPSCAALLFEWLLHDHTTIQLGRDYLKQCQWAAAHGLAALGEAAHPLRDDLVDLYRTGNERQQNLARVALGDREAVAALLLDDLREALQNGDPSQLHAAARLCADLRKAASPLFDVLLPLIAPARYPSEWRTMKEALQAIQAMGEVARPAVPVMLELLERVDRRDEFWLILALGGLGSTAQEALPTLEALRERNQTQGSATGDIDRAIRSIRAFL